MLRLAERQLNVKLEIYIFFLVQLNELKWPENTAKAIKKIEKKRKVILDQIKM